MRIISIIAVILVALVGAGLLYVLTASSPGGSLSGSGEHAGEPYVEIADPSGFVNTGGQSVTIGQYVRKKVILVDFLTYSCINCQRTFPYLNAWWDTYKDQGLQIIGIHTPEFAFEKDIDNVREAMQKFGIKYPIVLDNNYGTWRAYGNQYWPRKYLIDIYGNIVYDHIGEGAYDETEEKIQELLHERAQVLGEAPMPVGEGLAAASVGKTSIEARSPETYFGAARNEYLANGMPGRSGQQTFSLPQQNAQNRLYFGGTWNIQQEYAVSVMDASITYRFNAKDVYFVAAADTPTVVEVLLDGQPVASADRGADVAADSTVTVTASGLYHLIGFDNGEEHVLELRIQSGSLRAYTFTFG